MNHGDPLALSFQPLLVALAYLLSVVGSYAALMCAREIRRQDGTVNLPAVAGAGLALGGVGIWSMHFIAMTSQRFPVRVDFEPGATLESLVVAVAVAAAAFWYVGREDFRYRNLVVASTLAGVGVASMHYIGMAAMASRIFIVWDYRVVALSVIVAIVAANAALWLAFRLRGNWQQFGASLLMGAAVTGMHYTGVFAGTPFCTTTGEVAGSLSMRGEDLPFYVFGVASVVVIVVAAQVALVQLARAQANWHVAAR
ncbi:MAG: signal protein [Proteobacteria bacterium]|nr:signal protein [Pseudomonadota bacterium]